jgi:hypothetical protein
MEAFAMLSGPMSGNGLPIVLTLGQLGGSALTLFFCISTGDCPGGRAFWLDCVHAGPRSAAM